MNWPLRVPLLVYQPFNFWGAEIQTSTSHSRPDRPLWSWTTLISDIIAAPHWQHLRASHSRPPSFFQTLKKQTDNSNLTWTCDCWETIRTGCDLRCLEVAPDDISKHQTQKHIIYLHPCTWHPKFKHLYLSPLACSDPPSNVRGDPAFDILFSV